MNVSESNDVYTLLRWLGAEPTGLSNHIVTHRQAGEALARLGERAGSRLQLTVPEAPVVEAVERFGAVVTAARGVVAAAANPTVVDGSRVEAIDALRWAIHECKAQG